MDWLKSSADPKKISLTIKGLLVFVPSLIVLLSAFGFSIDADDLSEVITQFAVVASGIATIYGLGRKIKNSRKPNPM